jgi:hypothetical protein
MEKPAFTRTCLSNVRVVVTNMCVPLVERLSQAVMGQILALKYLLPGARGCLRPCPIMAGFQCRCLQRTRPQ